LLIQFWSVPSADGSQHKLNKNNHFRSKNQALLKESAKLERSSQSNEAPIIVQSETTMTGLLLNPTKANVSPEGLLPHESAIRARAAMQASPAANTSRHVLTARLGRLLDRWKAAAVAYCEQQNALLELHRAGDREWSSRRIYHGPLDDALERAARFRKRSH